MPALTLYVDGFWISPYAFSAFVALEEKGVPYTAKELALQKKEHHDPSYQAASLTGRVPSLRDGDFWLSESSAIGEYLEDKYPPPKHPALFPADVQERARCRQLMAWVRSDLMPIREERATHTMFYQRTTTPLSKAGEAAATRVVQAAEHLIRDGKTTLFKAWCLADADFGMMLQRLNLNGYPLSPKVKAYAEAQWARPSAKKFVDRKRPPYVPY